MQAITSCAARAVRTSCTPRLPRAMPAAREPCTHAGLFANQTTRPLGIFTKRNCDFSGLFPPPKKAQPPSMASPRWSLKDGLARAWGPSCGNLSPEYYDRVLSVSNNHCCLVR